MREVHVRGQTLQFPDGTPDDVIDAAVKRDFFGGGDVRSRIATRNANPNPQAFGDPRAQPESTLETYAPFLAHPIDTGMGIASTMAGGVQALAHPIDAFKSDWNERGAAYDRIKQRGLMSDDPENLRDAASMVMPFAGPAFAAAGRQMNSPDASQRAQGTGSAIALTSGPKIAESFAGDVGRMLPDRESAIAQYQKIIDPQNQNPQVARQMAERLINEKQTLSDPRTQLTNIQEGRAQTADANINTAIDNMKQPVSLDNVNKSLESAKGRQMTPYGPDSEATIKGIEKYQKDVLPVNAWDENIDPQTARELRQQFDAKPYGKESTTADANARKAVGDSLRTELNADPNVKAANEAFQREKAGKDLAESIPPTKQSSPLARIARLSTESAATGLAHMLGAGTISKVMAGTFAAAEVAKLVRDVIKSPGYKTWSAIKKSQFAKAVAAKDVARIGEIAGSASPFGAKDKDR